LGWNTRDWDEVHREYRSTRADSPVDYALKVMREPRLFVEAKGLGEDLSERKWVAQVLGYATVAGVRWCVLTNGDEWRFYNSAAAVDADEKLFRRVSVSNDDSEDVIWTLSLLARDNIEGNLLGPLWEAHFVDRKVKSVLIEMLESADQSLIRSIRKRLPQLMPQQITASLGRLQVDIGLPAMRHPSAGGASSPPTCPSPARQQTAGRSKLRDMCASGKISLPMRLFSEYKGQRLEATLLHIGEIEFQGKRYASPSAAGTAARASISGRRMATNGWDFWRFQSDGQAAQTLADLRSQCAKG
jgi:hypothetical protein